MKRFLNADFEKFCKNIAKKTEAYAGTADVAGFLGDYPVLLSVSMFKGRSRVLLEYCSADNDDDHDAAWVKVHNFESGTYIERFYLSDPEGAADFIISHSKKALA